jgi:hypothetical protein
MKIRLAALAGVALAMSVVDVLSFHDYTSLRSTIEEAYRTAEVVSTRSASRCLLY